MIGKDKEFDSLCGEYLNYLYRLCEKNYNDCLDIDSLVQESLVALLVKLDKGENVEYPKGFLSAVLKNKYNSWLRRKYTSQIVEYTDGCHGNMLSEDGEYDEKEEKSKEYEAVRREIGRLIDIYREVTVRHYVHGQTVDQIAKELNIPRGTVLSRLSAARDQIKKGIKKFIQRRWYGVSIDKYIILDILGKVYVKLSSINR